MSIKDLFNTGKVEKESSANDQKTILDLQVDEQVEVQSMEQLNEQTANHNTFIQAREQSRPLDLTIKQMSVNEEIIENQNSEDDHEMKEKKGFTVNENLFIYDFDEAEKASKEYFNGDSAAAHVWVNKYALRDEENRLREKTPEDMHRRLAKEFARIEKKYPTPISVQEIFTLLDRFAYIIPQGSPMFGMGNNFQVSSLSNCFVIGQGENADSYGAIMKTDEEQVQLMKRRGGVGHDLSHIRPEGSRVHNSALTSTGIVPFMERYSNSTKEVAQGGRRGALMMSISIKHPDVEKFIDAKTDESKITGANVSVRIDDEFMECVKNNKPYVQQYPILSSKPSVRKEINAGKLWKKIIHNAWKSAEPGVLFWDTIKKESIPDCYTDMGFESISTNPCGEIPLCAYDSCRLLSINLFSYVENPFTAQASFNFDKLKEHTRIAQRLMDDLVDLELEKIEKIIHKINKDPEEKAIKQVELDLWKKIKEKAVNGRRTGLGITAEGDMLAALNIRYGTEEAIQFAVTVHKTITLAAYRSSLEMAKERGKFQLFNKEKESKNPFLQRIKNEDPDLYSDMMLHGRRNIALLTIPPTGSVSMCTQTSSGIEPVVKVTYMRNITVNPNDGNIDQSKVTFNEKTGKSHLEYRVIHPKFRQWAAINGHNEDLDSLSDKEIQKLITQSPYHQATSHEIDWQMKVKMQGAIQKWIDHSISVTVNMPKNVTEENVHQVYLEAWESGCKGMTIYRDGSRHAPPIVTSVEKEDDFTDSKAPKRPESLEADVIRFLNKAEPWMAVVGLYNGRPYEIFTGSANDGFYLHESITKGTVVKAKDKENRTRYDFHYIDREGYPHMAGGLSRAFQEEFWNYAKLISGILRHGMPLSNVIRLVNDLRLVDANIHNWRRGVVRALSQYLKEGESRILIKERCPVCKSELFMESGCMSCPNACVGCE
jgi:ribonucleoside-diphosphate reductase alpha chain